MTKEELLPSSSSSSSILLTQDTMNEFSPLPSTSFSKKRRRQHVCIYCDVPVNNFARHLERQHHDELEVQKFLHLQKSNIQRKNIIDKIRKEGDFCSGAIIPVQDKKRRIINENESNFLPCIHCKGCSS